jgi:CBS domain-containing protein
LEDATMTTVLEMLKAKGSAVYAVRPDESVYEALKLMAERNIGAVMVTSDDGQLVGILSERDYARKVVLRGQTSRDTPVSAIMTANVVSVPSDITIEQCMGLMTMRHIRHLPVVDGGLPIGMVSIGDLGKAMIDKQGFVIEQLEKYIHGVR